MSQDSLIKFLSQAPLYQSKKQIMIGVEDFFAKEFLVRPILVYSIQDKIEVLSLDKCRTVIGKNDRLKLYSHKIIEKILSKRNELKELKYLIVEIEGHYYYYLNLGKKKKQFYFSLFSSLELIPEIILEAISSFSQGQMNILDRYEEVKKSEELIHIDDVTGLFNQRKLYKDISLLVEKFEKEHDPFCILFIDIDYFKKVNDNYGHLVGTRLLESVAKEIKKLLRDTDISYRYGGDEFVVILTNTEISNGKLVGERILEKVRNKEYSIDPRNLDKKIKLSVSIGVAEFPTDAKNSEEVLAIADRMMYEAKEAGRGTVFCTKDAFRSSLKKVVEQK